MPHHFRIVLARVLLGSLCLAWVGCKSSGEKTPSTSPAVAASQPAEAREAPDPADGAQPSEQAPQGQAVGYFAGGCFWGVEHFLERMDGVANVESGYMGGAGESPSYEEVSHGDSGHVETVRVTFDPGKTSYQAVAKRFFEIHDPTEVNRQGPDIGKQYRSAVFVTDAQQREVVEELVGKLRANGYKVATAIEQAGPFWPAEGYHQDYYERTGKTPYCHAPVPRFDRRAGE